MTPPDRPAGTYQPEPEPTPERRTELINEIEMLPGKTRAAVVGLVSAQLDTLYRNWTVRQIVHHLADSHINAYVRFRLALTEETPTIKGYDESKWSALPDATTADIEESLKILEGVHSRWVTLLRAMTDADFRRAFHHPEHQKSFTLAETLGLYAHHGRHHTGQIEWLRKEHGWGG